MPYFSVIFMSDGQKGGVWEWIHGDDPRIPPEPYMMVPPIYDYKRWEDVPYLRAVGKSKIGGKEVIVGDRNLRMDLIRKYVKRSIPGLVGVGAMSYMGSNIDRVAKEISRRTGEPMGKVRKRILEGYLKGAAAGVAAGAIYRIISGGTRGAARALEYLPIKEAIKYGAKKWHLYGSGIRGAPFTAAAAGAFVSRARERSRSIKIANERRKSKRRKNRS